MFYDVTLKDDEELRPNNHYVTEYHTGQCRLTILDIYLDDEAEYKCQATNKHGVDSTSIEIFVESKNLLIDAWKSGIMDLTVPVAIGTVLTFLSAMETSLALSLSFLVGLGHHCGRRKNLLVGREINGCLGIPVDPIY